MTKIPFPLKGQTTGTILASSTFLEKNPTTTLSGELFRRNYFRFGRIIIGKPAGDVFWNCFRFGLESVSIQVWFLLLLIGSRWMYAFRSFSLPEIMLFTNWFSLSFLPVFFIPFEVVVLLSFYHWFTYLNHYYSKQLVQKLFNFN
ncbi:hypothetical protein Hanom_Chr05g00429081 [Helianthus anomalus]